MLAACVVSIAGGCGQGNALGTVPVSGKATYKGAPVAGAIVTFLPKDDARPATAITTADGSYQLLTLDAAGAMPGSYVVLVRKSEIPAAPTTGTSMEDAVKLNTRPPPLPKELLPAKYGDAAKTPLKFEVKKGQTNTFDLQLAD